MTADTKIIFDVAVPVSYSSKEFALQFFAGKLDEAFAYLGSTINQNAGTDNTAAALRSGRTLRASIREIDNENDLHRHIEAVLTLINQHVPKEARFLFGSASALHHAFEEIAILQMNLQQRENGSSADRRTAAFEHERLRLLDVHQQRIRELNQLVQSGSPYQGATPDNEAAMAARTARAELQGLQDNINSEARRLADTSIPQINFEEPIQLGTAQFGEHDEFIAPHARLKEYHMRRNAGRAEPLRIYADDRGQRSTFAVSGRSTTSRAPSTSNVLILNPAGADTIAFSESLQQRIEDGRKARTAVGSSGAADNALLRDLVDTALQTANHIGIEAPYRVLVRLNLPPNQLAATILKYEKVPSAATMLAIQMQDGRLPAEHIPQAFEQIITHFDTITGVNKLMADSLTSLSSDQLNERNGSMHRILERLKNKPDFPQLFDRLIERHKDFIEPAALVSLLNYSLTASQNDRPYEAILEKETVIIGPPDEPYDTQGRFKGYLGLFQDRFAATTDEDKKVAAASSAVSFIERYKELRQAAIDNYKPGQPLIRATPLTDLIVRDLVANTPGFIDALAQGLDGPRQLSRMGLGQDVIVGLSDHTLKILQDAKVVTKPTVGKLWGSKPNWALKS